jgi:hypothetical protein
VQFPLISIVQLCDEKAIAEQKPGEGHVMSSQVMCMIMSCIHDAINIQAEHRSRLHYLLLPRGVVPRGVVNLAGVRAQQRKHFHEVIHSLQNHKMRMIICRPIGLK